WGPARVFSVGPAPPGSFEAALGLARLPLFAVDLRAAEGEVNAWLGSRSATRVIRGYFVSEQRALERHAPRRSFDAMIFVDEVTAARPNPPLPAGAGGGAR